jgi:hypothetical protein
MIMTAMHAFLDVPNRVGGTGMEPASRQVVEPVASRGAAGFPFFLFWSMTMSSDRRIDAQDMVDAMNELAEAFGAAKTLVRYINDQVDEPMYDAKLSGEVSVYLQELSKRFMRLSENALGVLDLIRFEVRPPSDQPAG